MNQKLKLAQILLATAWLAFMATARAQLNIPGADGSDGVLETPPDAATLTIVTIDLAQAVTGKWDDNNSANAGKGVYDPEKWAVVFKYTSVNIRTNTVIKFKNHPSRAPVVWLVNGEVVVAGEINLSGNAPEGFRPPEPGPGGFRGSTAPGGGLTGSGGFGPGGGNPFQYAIHAFAPGQDFNGVPIGVVYNNARIIPLLGGSGGGIHPNQGSGGSGGGAILVAGKQVITIHGRIVATSGPALGGYSGSGGAIRIIGNEIAGHGELNAAAGPAGRIRLESPSYAGDLQIFPPTLVAAPDNPPLVWPRENAATARIVSVTGLNAPSDPLANLEASGADIAMQDDQPVDVVIETRNLNIDTAKVGLRISPRNGPAQVVPAVFSAGTSAQATWLVNTRIPEGFAALQVRAVGQ